MMDLRKLPLVLATLALVLGATIAIAGSGSDRLERRKRSAAAARPLADPAFVKGLASHRFQVTAHTLRGWLSGPTPPLVVDLRASAPFKAGHVPGAISRPLEALLGGKAPLAARGRQVVLVDQDGRLAPYILHALRSRGVDAYLLAGGYAAWMAPSASRQAERRAAAPGAARPAADAVAPPPPSPPPAISAPPPPAAPPPRASGAQQEDAHPAEEGC
ncbi:MAG: rhodanese-like domain-containing protein [Polyangia bacterium]|jgi:rhodanese-related sulfurtransferase|nr:rhodanese-like domain-containing protein [Polyangia bacterium]